MIQRHTTTHTCSHHAFSLSQNIPLTHFSTLWRTTFHYIFFLPPSPAHFHPTRVFYVVQLAIFPQVFLSFNALFHSSLTLTSLNLFSWHPLPHFSNTLQEHFFFLHLLTALPFSIHQSPSISPPCCGIYLGLLTPPPFRLPPNFKFISVSHFALLPLLTLTTNTA